MKVIERQGVIGIWFVILSQCPDYVKVKFSYKVNLISHISGSISPGVVLKRATLQRKNRDYYSQLIAQNFDRKNLKIINMNIGSNNLKACSACFLFFAPFTMFKLALPRRMFKHKSLIRQRFARTSIIRKFCTINEAQTWQVIRKRVILRNGCYSNRGRGIPNIKKKKLLKILSSVFDEYYRFV